MFVYVNHCDTVIYRIYTHIAGPWTTRVWTVRLLYFLKIYLFLDALGLRSCAWAFSSCSSRAPLRSVRRLLIAVASLAEHRPKVCWLSSWARTWLLLSVWDLPGPGIGSLFLRWQADSQPLDQHGGSEAPLIHRLFSLLAHYRGTWGSLNPRIQNQDCRNRL